MRLGLPKTACPTMFARMRYALNSKRFSYGAYQALRFSILATGKEEFLAYLTIDIMKTRCNSSLHRNGAGSWADKPATPLLPDYFLTSTASPTVYEARAFW